METTKPLPAVTKKDTDHDKFIKERNAANHLRDGLCFLVGWTSADDPEISKKLEDLLDKHDENRVQNWY